MVNILVSDAMSEEGLAPLLNADNVNVVQTNASEVDDLSQFDALLVRSQTKVDAQLIDKMTNLKIIARAGVGVDNIDIDAATSHGIVVINAPDGNTISTAEHTFAMIASLVRNIPQATSSIKAGNWKRSAFQGRELNNKTLGIVGMGRIGSEIAKRAKAFNMKVKAFDPFLAKQRAEKMGIESVSLEEILETCDIITVHTPLTKQTRGLINNDNLATTKKGVFLVNCARGGIIDESALANYLDKGHVAGVALDVFEVEPPEAHPLLAYEQVIATPHIAASTKEAQLNVATQVAEEVLHFFEGKPAQSSINLPALPKEVFERMEPFYNLTKTMGRFLSQCMKEPVKEVSITYGGDIADLETSVTTRALLVGFLQERVDTAVNEVNASMLAKQRDIQYGETITTETKGYSNLVEVKVRGEHTTFTLSGTYIKEYGMRIVNVNDFDIDFFPKGHLVYIHHNDQPGVIGQVGKILGKHEINIATMQVGRKSAGGEAIMMLSFDRALTENAVNDLSFITELDSLKNIEL
ncbi:phosphoglycerate dehydrogenase [Aureibacillus halotolerans]|uniref:D-3-phosphoglycerate dehydrogenase n=1 Tax=Aureibacillus halotolerans TaxID=1508390 RepID=A0A4R6U504_9BACI|nr:phosphoglycerate dehydrogenase [Aureibacillus halotolerans]TDQ41570.1 D-3-phosphoglycerate dehydrogenase [Aureibacillus halotolerans]